LLSANQVHYPVKYLLVPDEGHGYARPVNNVSMLIAAEDFFGHSPRWPLSAARPK
jgi:dipeptidyl aminopeptidase/acylaminoacyl peptidase